MIPYRFKVGQRNRTPFLKPSRVVEQDSSVKTLWIRFSFQQEGRLNILVGRQAHATYWGVECRQDKTKSPRQRLHESRHLEDLDYNLTYTLIVVLALTTGWSDVRTSTPAGHKPRCWHLCIKLRL